MTREFASNVSHDVVPHASHWLPEENPEYFVQMIQRFLVNKGFITFTYRDLIDIYAVRLNWHSRFSVDGPGSERKFEKFLSILLCNSNVYVKEEEIQAAFHGS